MRPPSSNCYRSFESFCSIFSGIVEAASYQSPLRSVAQQINPNQANITAVIEKLCEGVTSRAEYDFGEVIEACRAVHAFE